MLALACTSAAATKPGSGSTTGEARVFVPNPVQDLGNQDLTDQTDDLYGAAVAGQVEAAFASRGIL